MGEYRRACRVHHFLARRHHRAPQSIELVPGATRRPRRRFAARIDGKRAKRPLMARRPASKAKASPVVEVHVEQPGPTEISDPLIRREVARAAVWLGMALAIVGVVVLAQPLLLIIGGLVFSVVLDGGSRLVGRVLPIGRGWRLLIVTLAGFGFIAWVFWFAGTTFVAQFEVLRAVVTAQFYELLG